jgi:hypothetical protein
MVLCPDDINITPCPMAILSTQRKLHRGGYFHLLRSPFGAAAAKEHCPKNAPFLPDVATGVVQAQLVTAFAATAAAKRMMKIRVMR